MMQPLNKKNLHQVVDHFLAQHRGRIAIEQDGRACSYEELDARSASLCAWLKAEGVVRGDVVALPMPASIDYVAALLGVVRAGAVFMPVDPAFPEARLCSMLELATPRAAIGSDTASVARIAACGGIGSLLVLGDELPEGSRTQDIIAGDDDTGYLIATSGSTGEPKLIAGRNKGISHFVHWEKDEFGIDGTVRASFFAPPTFDVSLREIFVPLLAGGTLVIPSPQERGDARKLAAWLRDRRVTLVHCVPSLLRLLTRALAEDGTGKGLPDLKLLALAGEPLYGADVAAWRAAAGDTAQMVNLYGPSETTLAKAFHRIGHDVAPNAIVPLGQPINNTALLILRNGRLCEIGEIGELHIHTPFASNGYFRNPELTAQAFIANPLAPDGAVTVYRTGDLARYLPDRSVEFVGRADRQVKVNGVRIELPEIEAALRSHPKITESAAHTFRLADGENILVGYYTSHEPLDAAGVREKLQETLPDGMLPAYLVQLPEFPRNLNGKIDRRALPRPESMIELGASYVAPASEMEADIAAMWAQALGLDKVSVITPWLQIGGNSLRAIGLIGRIGQRFGVDITIRDFFEAATVRALAARIGTLRPAEMASIPAAPAQDSYPLTDAQAGLWLLDRFDDARSLYNNVEWLELSGQLDKDALHRAFAMLVARHPSLRTAYFEADGEPRQRVLPAGEFSFRCEPGDAARVTALLADERQRKFNLESGELVSVQVIEQAPDRHHLIVNMHHIACDGWSMAILVKELAECYALARAGKTADAMPAPENARSICDLAVWQAGRKDAARAEAWRARLADAASRATIPGDVTTVGNAGRLAAGVVALELSAAQSAALRQNLAASGATPFMAIAAALSVLMYRHGGSETVIIGTPLAGRSRAELAGTVGFMVNTLPLVLRLSPDMRFSTLLGRARQAIESLSEGEFDSTARWAGTGRSIADPTRSPFYDVVLAMEPAPAAMPLDGLQITEHAVPGAPARNDLSLRLQDDGIALKLILEYRQSLYSHGAASALLQQLAVLLDNGSRQAATPLAQLPMLTDAQLASLNTLAQGPKQALPATTIHAAFDRQADANPEAVALVSFDDKPGYRWLQQRANRIAACLIDEYGVQPGDVVAVLLEREPDWPAAMLGIMKAGAVYMPLDSWHPAARHQALLDDAGAAVLISRGKPEAACPVLDLDTLAGLSDRQASVSVTPDAPAYLIYTSGSTGMPKGVLVSHRAFLNMMTDQIAALGMRADDTVLQFVSPAFDVSVFEVFLALLSGARLGLADRRLCNTPQGFAEALARLKVTVAAMTPGFLNSLGGLPLTGLRMIISGGEAPIPADVASCVAQGIRYVNAYGPTEAAVCAAFYDVDPSHPVPVPVPVGRPTANTALHVVAPDLTPLPAGAVGELAIAGAGLAIGYHRRPSATEQAFVTGSLAASGERLYRTGDRVRRMADGSLVFVGRADSQVKIRGHRVEPGEVEAALRQQPGVRDARVIACAVGQDTELAAYWTGDADADGLRHTVSRMLPEYMVPRQMVHLDALPLNANGKLDRSRLPAADASGGASFEAPRNPDEAQLAALWKELLGRERVGRDDDFFACGGRSLAANRLALRAARALGVTVDLRDIYAAPTPASLAARVRGRAIAPQEQLEILPSDQPAPLSPMQRRLWVIDQLGEAGPAYHICGLTRLRGKLDAGALRAAFDDVAARHAVLRTRFVVDGATPVQVTDVQGSLHWILIAGNEGDGLHARLEEIANRPFDLRTDWPIRVALAQVQRGDTQEWLLLIVLHHIAADGWSMPILEADLQRAYTARTRGAAPEWPPLPAQYRDIAAWLERRLDAGAFNVDRDYWMQQMAAPLPLLDLPADHPRPAVRRFLGKTLEHRLDDATVQAARGCAQTHGVTLFTVLLAGLQMLLYRLSGQDDLIIGVPVAGRQHPASEGLIGFFVNTLPVRESIHGDAGFAARLAGASEAMRQAMFHQHYPFDRLVGELGIARDTSRSALFDVMIGLDEAAPPPAFPGVSAEAMPLARSGSRCDMAWMFEFGAQAPAVRVEYDTDLFDAARIEDWIRRFELLLRQAVAAPHQALATLPLLAPDECRMLLDNAAAPPTTRPDVTVLQLFEAQAARHGSRVAILTDQESWTYADLNRAANRLARKLQRHRQRLDAPIALLLERGPLMVAAQLAVMKCGAAYLPIEPDAPLERVSVLLADSGAEILLHDPAKRIDGLQAPVMLALAIPEEESAINLRIAVSPEAPIYVMYTSGSTGRPKGVVALHRGVTRLVRDSLYYSPDAGDCVLQLSNYAFDGATFDFYAALANGLTLCIPDQDTLLDPRALAAFAAKHGANVSFITTALFNRIVDEAPDMLPQLRRLYFGGQEASMPHVRRAFERMTPGSLVHVYGPTECTTFATWHTVRADDLHEQAVRLPIGRPVAQTSGLLLDAQRMLVPAGIPAELYIGGAGLAQGYLGQPELTAERFVASPFSADERLYRTGDLCVQRPDGAIEFLGRLDGQVKVRGFRIELGEVEHHLGTCPGIEKVHVMPRRNAGANMELVAYFTAQQPPSLPALLSHLEKSLPRYMLPSHFVHLDAMPLNRNGKVDRQALPPPESGSLTLAPSDTAAAQEESISPGGNEAVLMDAWKHILGRDAIGLHDNYFALGGDSIQAIQIVSRLRAQGYGLKVTDLLRYPTIAQLAPRLVAGAQRATHAVREGEHIPLTPIQHWMIERHLPAPHHFNQSVLLRLPPSTDVQRLRRALAALEAHHAALRLRFGTDAGGKTWQHIAPVGEPPEIAEYRLGGEHMIEKINRIQRSLQPATGPIWRAALFHPGDSDGDRLLLTVHHWAVDGVSWRILLEDLASSFEQANQATITLPPPSAGFADWSLALQDAASSSRFSAQLGWWQQQVQADTGSLPLLGNAGPALLAERFSTGFALSPQQSADLFGACHEAYRTRSDELLLAAWVRALTSVQQHPACRIVLESHGRQAFDDSIDAGRTVGWFTAIYPLVFRLEGEDWSAHIREVKETLRAVPDNGIGYGLLRYLRQESTLQGKTGEVVFNYLGRFDHREQPLPLAEESTGDELDPAIRLEQGLDVSAELRDGTLRVRLVGDTGRHPESCFVALRDAFEQALTELVAHCLSADAGALSPSDVDLAGIGIADLDNILDSLEGS